MAAVFRDFYYEMEQRRENYDGWFSHPWTSNWKRFRRKTFCWKA